MVLGHDIHTSERTQDVKITEDISFDSMLLSHNTLAGLKTSGFYVPSPIQLHGIPLGKCGFDLLLEAKSGTGKTAVFAVIALEKLNLAKGVQSLILAPTREIAFQICDVIKTIGAFYEGLCVEVVMGGLPFAEDVEKFKKKVHIVVGSPGRLHYLIKDKCIDVSSVRLMVLDEADKLVEKSFLPDINFIYSALPSQKQIIMSSATYPDNVRLAIKKYVLNAHHICPDSTSVLLGIEQNVVQVPHNVNIVKQTNTRYKELSQILSKKQFKQCLVFCNYQVRVGEVHRMLNKDKWPADKLHGQQEQTDRLEALKVLQSYQCRILVTTDLAARGIDASNVDLVINFEPPYDWQTYLHRIGRAGRFGSYGRAISILSVGEEETKFKKILGAIGIPFNLKYLWTQEPYLIGMIGIDDDINHKKLEMIQKEHTKDITEHTQKMGKQETFDEIWKVLSLNSDAVKDIDDIPTFEDLNMSFQATGESSHHAIESFSDLLSSFEKHELKNNDLPMYKKVEINNLIKPSLILNKNLILQSISNKCITFKKIDKESNHETQTSCKKIMDINNCKSNTTDLSHRDEISSKNCISEYNNTNTEAHSSSKTCFDVLNNLNTIDISNKIISVDEQNIVLADENMNEFVNHHIQDSCKESDNLVYENGEYDEHEKSLLAANLPTAFGKVKQKKSKKSKQNKFRKVQEVKENSISFPRNTNYSSSDDEIAQEDKSYKCNSIAHMPQTHSKKLKISRKKQHNQSSNTESTEERQQQFNAWYQQLLYYRQMIEQSMYIEIMSSNHYY